ncbi:MAG: PorV/PorQ family protein [Elusimicrobia bacterium]|nr:PorV/PorQ family protein [Elusimicrobiota bacterium]
MRARYVNQKIQPGWIDLGFTWVLEHPYCLVLAFVFLCVPTYWLEAGVKSGADFLNIAVGARAVGMGSAHTASVEDVHALYWNPAGLAAMRGRELGFTHAEWLLGTRYDFLGFGYPTPSGAWGLGIYRLGQGSLEGRGANREATGGFNAVDQAFSLAYSKALDGYSSFGAGVKLLHSRIGRDTANSFALDLGAIHKLGNWPLSVGMTLQNLGPGMKFISQRDPLPLSATVGLAYRIVPGLHMALDLKRLIYDQETNLGIGTEYQFLPALSLRGGYLAALGQGPASGPSSLAGLGAGMGLKLFGTQLDYAMTPFGELGNAHRLSFNFQF